MINKKIIEQKEDAIFKSEMEEDKSGINAYLEGMGNLMDHMFDAIVNDDDKITAE